MNDTQQKQLNSLTKTLAEFMLSQALSLSVAESCTGGWLSKCCTDLAGSSAWFDRGFITYSNQAKQDLLNVSIATLEQFGSVSEQTAIEMAQGALVKSNTDISVAITGIAGPDGGTETKPVGTVWFAWTIKNGVIKTQKHVFIGDREQVRYQAVITALKGIIKNARD